MRTKLLSLAMAFLFLPLVTLAAEAQNDAAVKELDLKGLKRELPKGKIDAPTVLASVEELAKAFPEEDVQGRLKKEVDFTKQKLVFFAWSGSGGDRMAFQVEQGDKAPTVVFQYTRGLTRDLRSHFHLYTVPKDATHRVEAKK